MDLPPTIEAAEETTLLQTCSEAVSPERCIKTSPGELAQARVSWIDETTVLVRARAERRWHYVRLRFTEADDKRQRARTVGLAIASLLVQREPATQPTKPTTRRDAPRAKRPPNAGAKKRKPNRVQLTLGALGGPGLTSGAWRWGPWLSVGVLPLDWPVGIAGGARASWRPGGDEGLQAAWYAASLGVFARWTTTSDTGVEVGAAFAREWFTTTADARPPFTEDKATRAYASAEFSLSGLIGVDGGFSLLAGGLLSTTPGHGVHLRGEEVGENPAVAAAARMGARYSW